MHKNSSFVDVLQNLLGLVVLSITIFSTSAVTGDKSDDIEWKRFYITGTDECSDCGYNGRDYEWCRNGLGPDDWMHCSTRLGITSRGKTCRVDHRCKYHGKEFLWCQTNEGENEGAWDYCSWTEDMTRIPYTIDGKECYSFCKSRNGADKPSCRTNIGNLEPCKLSKDSRDPSEVVEFSVDGEKCVNMCKRRDGDKTRMCQTQHHGYVKCRASEEQLNQERADFEPELVRIYRESLTPRDEAIMALEREYWKNYRGEL